MYSVLQIQLYHNLFPKASISNKLNGITVAADKANTAKDLVPTCVHYVQTFCYTKQRKPQLAKYPPPKNLKNEFNFGGLVTHI